MNICTYSPQISPGNPNITPPSASGPTLVQVDNVVLTYPFVSPTMTVTLPTPEFNNRQVLRIERVTRETRGRTLRTFRYDIWPKIHRLAVSFLGLSPDQLDDFRALVKASVGKEIGYLDYESRQWKGIIINPDTAMSQEGPNCADAVRFDFEGELV